MKKVILAHLFFSEKIKNSKKEEFGFALVKDKEKERRVLYLLLKPFNVYKPCKNSRSLSFTKCSFLCVTGMLIFFFFSVLQYSASVQISNFIT